MSSWEGTLENELMGRVIKKWDNIYKTFIIH